jgi:hypothetical protein
MWNHIEVTMKRKSSSQHQAYVEHLAIQYAREAEPEAVIKTQKRAIEILDAKYEDTNVQLMVEHLDTEAGAVVLEVLNQYQKLFSGQLGRMQWDYKIAIKENAKPYSSHCEEGGSAPHRPGGH